MPYDRKDLYGFELSALGVAGAGAIMVFPTHVEIGWALLVGGSLAFGLAELAYRQPQLLAAVAQYAPGLRLPWAKPDPFMPLRDAARELYEANLDKSLGVYARGLSDGSEDGTLNWLGQWIANRITPVYGKRPGSTILEQIPPVRFTLGGFEGGAARIERDGQDTFLDLVVKRDAFRDRIPALSNTDMPSG